MNKKAASQGRERGLFVRTNAFVRSGIDFSQGDAAGKIYYYEKHVYTTFHSLFLFVES